MILLNTLKNSNIKPKQAAQKKMRRVTRLWVVLESSARFFPGERSA